MLYWPGSADDGTVTFYGNVIASLGINYNRGLVPLGGIIAVASHLAGSYVLPVTGAISTDGWMRADGATVPAGQGSPLEGDAVPNLTSSTFILGTDGSGAGVSPDDDPLSGASGGANSSTPASATASWSSSTVNTAFTTQTWSGSGSFSRLDFNTNQTSHTHTANAHTHDLTHSHSMKHVHEFAIWKYYQTGKLQYQQNDTYDYNQSELTLPEYVVDTRSVQSGAGVSVAYVTDQGSSSYPVTITIGSPTIITRVSHGLNNGTLITLNTTGALPSGLITGDSYYVVNATMDDFQIAYTSGGSAINTTGTQSGTQSFYVNAKYYTAGVVGENGNGSTARTATEVAISGWPVGSTDSGPNTAVFTGFQTVGISHTLTGGGASFDKTVMNTDQISHTHTITDIRPKYIAAVYLIRVK